MRTNFKALVLLSLLASNPLFAATGKKKDFTVEGYVLEVTSTGDFVMDGYRVLCGPATEVALQTADNTRLLGPCRSQVIRRNAELIVTGEYDPATEEIHATSITAPLQTRATKVDGTVMIERAPALTILASGSTGTIFADGRRLLISPNTEVRFAQRGSDDKTAMMPKVSSLDQVGPNVWAAYAGTQLPDGSISLDRIAFSRNAISPGEAKFRAKYDANLVEPDYDAKKPGKVLIHGLKAFNIVPDRAVQQKIAEIGMALVPQFQKALSDTDPMKIQFRFYLVDGLQYWITSSPNGSVFISSGLFSRLSNEAQLTGVIAAEVASVMQKQLYRQVAYNDWSTGLCWASLGSSAAFLPVVGLPLSAANIAGSVVASRRLHSLEEQGGRLAVEYAINAGYDGREVRAAFRTLSNNDNSGPKHKAFERAFYHVAGDAAASELGRGYAGTDFSKLNTGADTFKALATEVQKASVAK